MQQNFAASFIRANNPVVRVFVNGEDKELPAGVSLAELVRQLNLQETRIAIEVNREIIRRAAWDETGLVDGDRIEIVHFVGGGSILGTRVASGARRFCYDPRLG